ncbi:RES family NAD+ phosphorylase [Aliiglaciecola lipolytica]|uniref:RES family NAD+ phosphorylase n=1 Tax=Aliiglaciecola lipolytica TaxID=477689 RepID=UPI001D0387F2|nr:RES family NAD+ phosphorylase [Aliiglaciecola lipolytica]
MKCVNHNTLKTFVTSHGLVASCDYCDNQDICVDDEKFEQFLLGKAKEILVTTDELSKHDQAMIFECGSPDPHVFKLFDFFESHLDLVNESFVEQFIEKVPDETNQNGYSLLYVLNDGNLDELNDFEERWYNFTHSIRHSKRFFNKLAFTFCKDLFETIVEDGQLLKHLVVDLPVTQPLYRARVGYSIADIEAIDKDPINQLGAVPAKFASSQRMTPAGVSAFYAAFDRNTCISELRPIVGDGVVSGEFRPNRALKLLDLNILKDVQINDDIFSDRWLVLSHAYAFFPELVFKLTRPSSRNNQHDYLATQVIFEFLSTEFGSQINGIIYPSIQKNGDSQCVVLFPEYSQVKSGLLGTTNLDDPFEKNSPALCFVPESIKFHKVKSVSFEATEEDNSLMLTSSDSMLRTLFPSER